MHICNNMSSVWPISKSLHEGNCYHNWVNKLFHFNNKRQQFYIHHTSKVCECDIVNKSAVQSVSLAGRLETSASDESRGSATRPGMTAVRRPASSAVRSWGVSAGGAVQPPCCVTDVLKRHDGRGSRVPSRNSCGSAAASAASRSAPLRHRTTSSAHCDRKSTHRQEEGPAASSGSWAHWQEQLTAFCCIYINRDRKFFICVHTSVIYPLSAFWQACCTASCICSVNIFCWVLSVCLPIGIVACMVWCECHCDSYD